MIFKGLFKPLMSHLTLGVFSALKQLVIYFRNKMDAKESNGLIIHLRKMEKLLTLFAFLFGCGNAAGMFWASVS